MTNLTSRERIVRMVLAGLVTVMAAAPWLVPTTVAIASNGVGAGGAVGMG